MDNNANGEDVQEFRKQVCAKWRVYCKNRNLIPEVYPQMDQFCADLMDEYVEEYKAQDAPTPE